MARRTSLPHTTWLLSLSFRSVVVGALAISFTGCQDVAAPSATPQPHDTPSFSAAPSATAADAIPDEYIVTFADSVQDAPGVAKQFGAQHGATVHHTYSTALKGFAAHLSPQAAIALQHNPRIAHIEPDVVVTAADVQTNPTWALDRLDQRTRPLDNSFTYPSASGAGVNVYIIDSGIRATHREFGGRVAGGVTFVNDGVGTGDCYGHGTHIGALVGGSGVGVAKGVTLWSVRVFDCSGVTTSSAVLAAVDWVTKNRRLPAVANMSLSGATSSALNTAVANSIAAGVVYAVSAGNSARDACTFSPASVPAAITVAASTETDTQASFSNYGSCVDLYAPGTNIASADYFSDVAYTTGSGTSESAPLVAGMAALILAGTPNATPAQVASQLTQGATTGILTGLSTGSPNRLLNTAALTTAPITTPPTSPPPTDTTTTPPAPTSPPPTAPNAAPKASLTVTCSRSLCTLDASASSDDAGIVSYLWSFGDGSAVTTTPSAKTTYRYTRTGTFTATVTVKDTAGLTATAKQTAKVNKL